MPIIQIPKWTLEEALIIIRKLQSEAQEKSNYHLALAGSVLNYGESINDLDIIALPMDNGDKCYKDKLLEVFIDFTKSAGILKSEAEEYDGIKDIYEFEYNGKSIDLFLY